MFMKEEIICSKILNKCINTQDLLIKYINKFLTEFDSTTQAEILDLADVKESVVVGNELYKVSSKSNKFKDKFLIIASKKSAKGNTILKCIIRYKDVSKLMNQRELSINNLDENYLCACVLIDSDNINNFAYYFDIQKSINKYWLVGKCIARNYKLIERSSTFVEEINLEEILQINNEFTA